MAKRKLKDDSTIPSRKKSNPFICVYNACSTTADDAGTEDDLLVHTVIFLELEKQLANQRDGEIERSKLLESLTILMNFLANASSSCSNGEVLSEDIEASVTRTSTIVLPWVTRNLMEESPTIATEEDALYWKALAAVLSVSSMRSGESTSVDQDESKQAGINQALTTKVLLKLVPRASFVALRDEKSCVDATKCYEMLLARHFTPSLDMAYKLLLKIVETITNPKSRSPKERTHINSVTCILATLRTLMEVLKKANPKTAFQILSTEEALLVFSRSYFYFQDLPSKGNDEKLCEGLIRQILFDTFFHPDHHLDGFRSIVQLRGVPSLTDECFNDAKGIQEVAEGGKANKQSTFQCYQESLFKSVLHLLSPDDNSEARIEQSDGQYNRIFIVSRILPLLFECFLENLSVYEDNSKQTATKKRGSSKVDVAQMQLFFFATIAVPLWNQNHVHRPCLQSLSQCLQLLLKYDVFVPSGDEKQLARYDFLEALTTGVLETKWPDSEASLDAANIVKTMVLLDHELVHDKLEVVLSFCATQYILEKNSACNLLLSLVNSYRQLRQINDLFSAILGLTSTMRLQENCDDLKGFSSLLSESCVQCGFADAIKENPSLEVNKMFGTLNAWIVEASIKKIDLMTSMGLSIAVQQIGVCFLGNVRVDKSTASEIATNCKSLKRSVDALCENGNNPSSGISQRTKQGITLCAWVINLQMRCAFWLGYQYIRNSEIEMPIPHKIRDLLLSSVVKESNNDPSDFDKTIYDDLLLLASFRLRQLDYLVHEQYLEESEGLSLREEYNEEATRLAGIMVEWASDNIMVLTSRWHRIAQVITTWVSYANAEHLRVFLMWLFSALADTADREDAAVTMQPSGLKQHISVYERERAVALSLVRDASFVELNELSDLFTPCALLTVLLLLKKVAKICSHMDFPNEAEKESIRTAELCLMKTGVDPTLTHGQFVNMLKWRSLGRQSIKVPENAVSLLRGALRVVKTLNGLPLPHYFSASVNYAAPALRLEAFCRQPWSKAFNAMHILQDLLSTLRLTVCREMSVECRDVLAMLPATACEIQNTLSSIRESTSRMLALCESVENEQSKRLLFATEELNKTIVRCCVRKDPGIICDTIHSHVLASFRRDEELSDIETMVLCSSSGSVFIALSSAGDFPSETDKIQKSLMILTDWIIALPKRQSFLTSPMVRFHSSLFSGSVGRLLSTCFRGGIPSSLTENVETIVTNFIPGLLSGTGKESCLKAALYLVSCYALTTLPFHLRQCLIDTILQLGREDPWIEASICSLVREMDENLLYDALSKITRAVRDESKLGLRLFQVLIKELKKEEQIQVASNFAEAIFYKSLEALHSKGGSADCDRVVANATSVITELTREKRLIAVKEREVALILAQTSSVLHQANLSNGIYSSCFSLVATLMQRFPKQLYTCVPSLIASLNAFQWHVLHGDLDEIAIRERSQKYTRLCELLLPHKEVYKKHVLGVLLEFVHCLEHDMSIFRKECLMPSVFYLLDMLSKYEMQQLNTLMGTTAKTLFRSVHQNYQKLHTYKGH